ncbi:dihydrolipoyl dehydrogenase family protein [Lacticaseibacillus zeae]|uniref:NAD(P)/FAD-dependent oxidoreductase n=1 Tax=Lacticaseibacillus zeae subsp. silagei TaxID=3068307 RepID=A0ABD7Z835_LACZE|nr:MULTISPECIES: NAD(P)/FAD-dependent oxidoreductase [Lacticaseibacillus]MDE3316491.1 NAD(P)/FAD-dependent oxidoreductase [Lacticaseibacillus zeae]OFR96838.1 glutathione reductase [Lactobacillus sp. HMSC068F07]WLV83290.1 NAD(P)/FAD-dependent oxidoreductase [Lacticaseibacillus sp. NCIMB 15475]WLV86038.1 NAD(P)/FAD-dependent oxidoreductase [Lacticaseibacillus sp. NCIMB 15474]
MAYDYDTIVIGGGPGGLAAAYGLAAQQKVLVIEGDLWGGTCPNYGCDPKKMLYRGVEVKNAALRMNGFGISGTAKIDWPSLMAFKRGYTSGIPAGTLNGLTRTGIKTLYGRAQLLGEHAVKVGSQNVTGEHIVIATGHTPRFPDIPGANLLKTSRDFLDLDELPTSIAFIGAGYVSVELANIAAAAGAEVHIIGHSDRLLRAFPKVATEALKQLLIKSGIHFHPNVELTKISPLGTMTHLHADDFDINVDMAITAMGRIANVADLGLANAGIKADTRGIPVDDHLRTVVPNIYALGDVNLKPQPKLTPVAGFEGRYVASQILGDQEPIHYPAIPTIVFGPTELAKVGVALEDAEAAPDRYKVVHNDTTEWYTYHRLQDPDAQVWTIVDKTSGKLAGAVVLASLAEDLINTFAAAIDAGKKPAELNQIYAYPSAQSDLQYLF